MVASDQGVSQRSRPPEPEYEEITLADIVRVLHQRKIVLISVFLVALLVGVAITAFATPQYESRATMIPLEHQDIISNWLSSRHAAELVAEDMGDRIMPALFPNRWDDRAQSWQGEPPTTAQAGARLAGHVSVGSGGGVSRDGQRFLAVTVTFSDPQLTQQVAQGYIGTLEDLRPRLENITRQEAFDKYYDGSNEQQAQRRAEVAAQNKEYWIMLDQPLPGSQTSPNPVLNMSLAAVLGLFLGVFGAFFVEWLQNYRAEMRSLDVPDEPEEASSRTSFNPSSAERGSS